METERDLYRVCVPFTVGVLSGSLVFKVTGKFFNGMCSMLEVHYCIASCFALAAFGAAALAGALIHRKDKPLLLWLGVFLIMGLFCYATRAIALPTIPVTSHFPDFDSLKLQSS